VEPLSVSLETGTPHRVRLAGELDLSTAPEVSACLADLNGDVEIDCSRLDFVDGAGLREIVEAHHACDGRGATLTLVNPSPWVMWLLRLVELDGVLNVRQDRALA
jgi:anti-sigma B factor antagonist